jgi:hypothetical protein
VSAREEALRARRSELEGRYMGKVRDEIDRAVGTLFEANAVVEIRAFKEQHTLTGYFDEYEVLAEEAASLDGWGYAVYVTLNEVNPALLARAANRMCKAYRGKSTTSDTDITRRRWLPLDFDPVRPADVSSTSEERKAAQLRARDVRDYLIGQGWPEPVVGDSGNGAHLLYRIDLPNDRESLELVKGVLDSLAFKFNDELVKVDTAVHNAARIWKLYGTTARKGDDTEARPHHASKLLKVPEGVSACNL